jgi:hypothetical protein
MKRQRIPSAFFAYLLLAASTGLAGWFSSGPKVTFERDVAPEYYFGASAHKIVLLRDGLEHVEHVGESLLATDFRRAATFSHFFQVEDAQRTHNLSVALQKSGAEVEQLRSELPADLYAGLSLPSCKADFQTKSETEYDKKGKKTGTTTKNWYKGRCEVVMRVVDGKTGAHIALIPASGTDTSEYNMTEGNAISGAATSAVRALAEKISPRRAKVDIALQSDAPGFKEGEAMIKSKDYRGARMVWERTLESQRDSAPLNFNLGVVSEGMRDADAARKYHTEAARLAPSERKYREALAEFERRAANDTVVAKGERRLPE